MSSTNPVYERTIAQIMKIIWANENPGNDWEDLVRRDDTPRPFSEKTMVLERLQVAAEEIYKLTHPF